MRRIATALGAFAAAGMLVLAIPGSAHAATGMLNISGTQYVNPSGCYASSIWPMSVDNDTDRTASVYSLANCVGLPIATVRPGEDGTYEFGLSVRIP